MEYGYFGNMDAGRYLRSRYNVDKGLVYINFG